MKKIKYILASGAKYHHFSIAKILHQRDQLSKVISGYPWFKLKKEKIPKNLVSANGILQMLRYPFIRNRLFNNFKKIPSFLDVLNRKYIDKKICKIIEQEIDADVLITLCPTGLKAGREMQKKNKLYICERSSAHILYQEKLLREEYKIFMDKDFQINPYYIESELKMYEESNIILVPSQFVKNTFDKKLMNKVYVNEFGTDTENFFPDDKIRKSDKFFDILFIGQISLQKGLHYLVEAFNKLNHPNKRLHIVGMDTGDKYFFDKILNKENIIIYGHVPQNKLNEIINKCHVFVLPSIQDGFGIVTLQALSAGCPIIVTENTGPVEIINKYNCGSVVPIREANKILYSLQELADDRDKLEFFTRNAIKFANNNTWDVYVDRLNEIVSEALKKIN
jgi:alpha-maltose-1-phosphate synthase